MNGSHSRISPTAHYTGYVWYRNGLSHPAFRTNLGRSLYFALAPLNRASQRLGGPTLPGLLLARHRAMDEILEREIETGKIGQVVEIAAGLSPRGTRFVERYGDRITYVEADLPDMADRKRSLVARAGALRPNHRVVALDALAETGPLSLASLSRTLDAARGLAIVTEGLVNYFPRDTVTAMWSRFAAALGGFPRGLYLSDLHLSSVRSGIVVPVFSHVLSAFVRGSIHFHFELEAEASSALARAGFASSDVVIPEPRTPRGGHRDVAGASLVRVVQARTRGLDQGGGV